MAKHPDHVQELLDDLTEEVREKTGRDDLTVDYDYGEGKTREQEAADSAAMLGLVFVVVTGMLVFMALVAIVLLV